MKVSTNIVANIEKKMREQENNTKKGMWSALLFVMRPIKIATPVDTGNLINSYDTDVFENLSGQIVGEIKNTAEYALPVHEKSGQKFRKPGATNKFVETPLKQNADSILKILQRYSRQ